MPLGLKRYQTFGHDHAINFSCLHHISYLNSTTSRDLFERSLEQTRLKYNFELYACVVMPDHVHLLLSEPAIEPVSKAIQARKLSVSKTTAGAPFMPSHLGHEWAAHTARVHHPVPNPQVSETQSNTPEGPDLQSGHKQPRLSRHHSAEGRSAAQSA